MGYKFILGFIFCLMSINIVCLFPSPTMAVDNDDVGEYRPRNIDRGQRRAPAMNYVDAYGNSIFEKMEEAPREKRIGAGAYGGYSSSEEAPMRPLPDLPSEPKWSFE